MPLYEYRCDSCEHEFERLIRAGADEPNVCPECDAESVDRLISNTNFQLKGSGWYETDYARNDDQQNDAETNSSGEADEDSDGETSDADGAETTGDSEEATAAETAEA